MWLPTNYYRPLLTSLEFASGPYKRFLFFFLQLDRRTFSVAYRFLRAKSAEQRAEVDLDTHYTQVKHVFGFVDYFLLTYTKLSP